MVGTDLRNGPANGKRIKQRMKHMEISQCSAIRMPFSQTTRNAMPRFHNPLTLSSQGDAHITVFPTHAMNYFIRMLYLALLYSALFLAQPI